MRGKRAVWRRNQNECEIAGDESGQYGRGVAGSEKASREEESEGGRGENARATVLFTVVPPPAGGQGREAAHGNYHECLDLRCAGRDLGVG